MRVWVPLMGGLEVMGAIKDGKKGAGREDTLYMTTRDLIYACLVEDAIRVCC